MSAMGTGNSSTTGALCPRLTRPLLDVFRQNKPSVDPIIRCINRLTVHPGEEDKRQRFINIGWGVGKNVAKPDRQPILVQPCSVIEPGKREKFDFDFRQGRMRTESAVCCGEN